jgi:ribulose 1,5-bisphosphate carboxylase large subunit-like protein
VGDKVKLTYTPKDGDPNFVVVNNQIFLAGVPVEVANVAIAEKLSNNPWFAVHHDEPEHHEATHDPEVYSSS